MKDDFLQMPEKKCNLITYSNMKPIMKVYDGSKGTGRVV